MPEGADDSPDGKPQDYESSDQRPGKTTRTMSTMRDQRNYLEPAEAQDHGESRPE
jgi:hypothetical protein